jgi:limonene-1,2-epoxide hydrolase
MTALRAYCDAFAARDLEGMMALFHERSLCEIPNWPRRAYGHAQLRRNLERVTVSLATCEIDLRAVAGDESLALADGLITASRHGGGPLAFPFGMVVEVEGELIVRLTEYFDVAPFAPAR